MPVVWERRPERRRRTEQTAQQSVPRRRVSNNKFHGLPPQGPGSATSQAAEGARRRDSDQHQQQAGPDRARTSDQERERQSEQLQRASSERKNSRHRPEGRRPISTQLPFLTVPQAADVSRGWSRTAVLRRTRKRPVPGRSGTASGWPAGGLISTQQRQELLGERAESPIAAPGVLVQVLRSTVPHQQAVLFMPPQFVAAGAGEQGLAQRHPGRVRRRASRGPGVRPSSSVTTHSLRTVRIGMPRCRPSRQSRRCRQSRQCRRSRQCRAGPAVARQSRQCRRVAEPPVPPVAAGAASGRQCRRAATSPAGARQCRQWPPVPPGPPVPPVGRQGHQCHRRAASAAAQPQVTTMVMMVGQAPSETVGSASRCEPGCR